MRYRMEFDQEMSVPLGPKEINSPTFGVADSISLFIVPGKGRNSMLYLKVSGQAISSGLLIRLLDSILQAYGTNPSSSSVLDS